MFKQIENDKMIINLEDDLIAPNIDRYKKTIDEYMDEMDELDEVEVDIRSVENIDSIGVTFVIGLYKTFQKEGLGFVISHASSNVRQLFKLMQLDDLLE